MMNRKIANLIGLIYIIMVIGLLVLTISTTYVYNLRSPPLYGDAFFMVNISAYVFYSTYFIFFISIAYIFHFDIIKAVIIGVAESTINFIVFIMIFTAFPIGQAISANAPFFFAYIGLDIGLFFINTLLLLLKSSQTSSKEALVRKTVLELGTQFTRLYVSEISEVCNINKDTIVKIIRDMILNKEIYAEYYNSSKSISFNQRANIDEIDNLMAKYEEWEEQQVEKI